MKSHYFSVGTFDATSAFMSCAAKTVNLCNENYIFYFIKQR